MALKSVRQFRKNLGRSANADCLPSIGVQEMSVSRNDDCVGSQRAAHELIVVGVLGDGLFVDRIRNQSTVSQERREQGLVISVDVCGGQPLADP